MRRTLVYLLLPVIAFATILGWSGSALSEAGTCTDPEDDTFIGTPDAEVGAGALDIVSMDHSNTAETVDYMLTTKDPYSAEHVGEINWFIDADGDATGEDEAHYEGRVWVRIDGEGNFAGDVLTMGPATPTAVASATVVHDDDTDELTVSYPSDALEELGVEDSYDYYVETTEVNFERQDITEACTHDLALAAEPTPTPTPASTTTTVDLDSTTITQGGTLSGSSGGFDPESDATIDVFSNHVTLGTVQANASGVATFSFSLPASVTPGSHRVEMRGVNPGGATHLATGSFTVVAQVASPTPVPQGTALPASGGPIERSALMGVFLLAIGLALMTATLLRNKPRVGLPSPNGVWIEPLPAASTPIVSEPVEAPPAPRIGWAAPVNSWERRR